MGLVACSAVVLWLWDAIPKWHRPASLRTRLIGPVTLDFVETPLGEIQAFVRDYTSHDVHIDEASLNKAGIAADVPINGCAENLSLAATLRLLLSDVGLGFLVKDGAIAITSKEDAASRLSRKSSPVIWSTSAMALADADPHIRRSATYLMAYTRPSSDVVTALLKSLGDVDREVRINAAYALGELGVREAVPGLTNVATTRDSTECCAAVVALGKLGVPEGVPGLVSGLKNGAELFARRYLERLGPTAVQTAIDQLIAELTQENAETRAAAAMGLMELGARAEQTMPLLVDALQDEDAKVRMNAARAIAEVGYPPKSAVPNLVALSSAENSWERLFALRALRKTGASSLDFLPVIVDQLREGHKHIHTQMLAIEWLDEIYRSQWVLLQEPEYREQGLRMLAEIKPHTDQAVPALIDCAKSGHGRLREAARVVLEMIAPETLAALDEKEAAAQSVPLR
jgi:HEAT repeat protein